MSADPRTDAAAKARHDKTAGGSPESNDACWARNEEHREAFRDLVRPMLAAADAAALADVQLHARITGWIGRTYTADKPTPGQVRMVLAALTALNKEQP